MAMDPDAPAASTAISHRFRLRPVAAFVIAGAWNA